MNPANYASREAAQRLVDAGIVLETDFRWATHTGQEWELILSNSLLGGWITSYPAPTMAEVWRELPEEAYIKKAKDFYITWLCDEDEANVVLKKSSNTNPTDALIDLLIWVRKEKP